jgi:hypothetical protein
MQSPELDAELYGDLRGDPGFRGPNLDPGSNYIELLFSVARARGETITGEQVSFLTDYRLWIRPIRRQRFQERSLRIASALMRCEGQRVKRAARSPRSVRRRTGGRGARAPNGDPDPEPEPVVPALVGGDVSMVRGAAW